MNVNAYAQNSNEHKQYNMYVQCTLYLFCTLCLKMYCWFNISGH